MEKITMWDMNQYPHFIAKLATEVEEFIYPGMLANGHTHIISLDSLGMGVAYKIANGLHRRGHNIHATYMGYRCPRFWCGCGSLHVINDDNFLHPAENVVVVHTRSDPSNRVERRLDALVQNEVLLRMLIRSAGECTAAEKEQFIILPVPRGQYDEFIKSLNNEPM